MNKKILNYTILIYLVLESIFYPLYNLFNNWNQSPELYIYLYNWIHIAALLYFIFKQKLNFVFDWGVKIYILYFFLIDPLKNIISAYFIYNEYSYFNPEIYLNIFIGIIFGIFLFYPEKIKRIVYHVVLYKTISLIFQILFYSLLPILSVRYVNDVYSEIYIDYFFKLSRFFIEIIELILWILFIRYLNPIINRNPVQKFGDFLFSLLIISFLISFKLVLENTDSFLENIQYDFTSPEFTFSIFLLSGLFFLSFFLIMIRRIANSFNKISSDVKLSVLKLNIAGKNLVYHMLSIVLLIIISLIFMFISSSTKDFDTLKNLGTINLVIQVIFFIAIIIFSATYIYNFISADKVDNDSDLLKNPKQLNSISKKFNHIFYSFMTFCIVYLFFVIVSVRTRYNEDNEVYYFDDLNFANYDAPFMILIYGIILILFFIINVKLYQIGKVFSTLK